MCAPSVPTAQETAGAQTGTNVSTAIANAMLGNVNQTTPYGSLTYNQSGTYKFTDPNSGSVYDIPTFTANQTLTPGGQKIQDNLMGAQTNLSQTAETASGRLNNLLGKGINLRNAPRAGQVPTLQSVGQAANMQTNIAGAGNIQRTYGGDFSADRSKVENAIMSRAQGGLDRDKRALEARLADQGIEIGSSAYQSAMDDYGRNVNDMRTSAILAGGQEQSRMVGLEADRAAFGNAAQGQQFQQNAAQATFGNAANQQNFDNAMSRTGFNNDVRGNQFDLQNTARGNYLQEQYAKRNQGLNELLSLMNGSQVQNPNFVPTSMPQVATTDIAGLMGQEYQAKQKGWSDMMGLGGSLLTLLSDERAKTDITEVGKTKDGQKVYSYRYKHEGPEGPVHMGLMAQEVEKRTPEAVVTGADGFKRVNYGIALGV